ncbi:MAG: hypothetical protein AB7I41_03885 [Candidatus Sericytochromatia bacterium]
MKPTKLLFLTVFLLTLPATAELPELPSALLETELPAYNAEENLPPEFLVYPDPFLISIRYFFSFAQGGHRDGALNQALFQDINSVAVNQEGNTFFVADSGSLRKISGNQVSTLERGWGYEVVMTPQNKLYIFRDTQFYAWDGKKKQHLAGVPWHNNYHIKDGQGTSARLNKPSSLISDPQGNIYGFEGHCLRKYTSKGQVSTMAGNCEQVGNQDGQGAQARFNMPIALTRDKQGQFWIGEDSYGFGGKNNFSLRKVSTTGQVSTVLSFKDSGINFLTTLPEGDLLFSRLNQNNQNQMYRYSENGGLKLLFTGHSFPSLAELNAGQYTDGFAFEHARRWSAWGVWDGSGNMYSAVDGYLLRMDSEGNFNRLAGVPRLKRELPQAQPNFAALNHLLINHKQNIRCGMNNFSHDLVAYHPQEKSLRRITWMGEDPRYECGRSLQGAWSGEHAQVFFGNRQRQFYQVEPTGQGLQRLDLGQGSANWEIALPQWWSQLNQVAVLHKNFEQSSKYQIALIDAQQNQIQVLPIQLPAQYEISEGYAPALSPQNKSLLLHAWVLGKAETQSGWFRYDLLQKKLTPMRFPFGGSLRHLRWSPDGRFLAGSYQLNREEARKRKLTCPHGSCPETLVLLHADGRLFKLLLPFQQNRLIGHIENLRWSPNGQLLAIESLGLGQQQSAIELFNLKDSKLSLLLKDDPINEYNLMDW